MAFIFLLIFYLVCVFFERYVRPDRKLWTILLMFPLFLLSALRSPLVGNDTIIYFRSYINIKSYINNSNQGIFSPVESRFEPGYVLLMKIFGTLDLDFLVFQIFLAAFIYFSIGRIIYKYSSNIAMSVFVFISLNMFFQTMNISRQYIAIAILTYSINYIVNKKPLRFLLIVLMASLFHLSAVVFVIIYPLSIIKLNQYKRIQIIGIGILAVIGFDYLVRFLTTTIFSKYESYLDSRYFEVDGKIAIYVMPLLYFFIFILGNLSKYGKNTTKIITDKDILSARDGQVTIGKILNAAALAILVLSIIGIKTAIMSRFIHFFLFFYLLYIPNVLRSISNKHLKSLCSFGTVVILSLNFLIVLLFRPNWQGIIPFSWYWEFN